MNARVLPLLLLTLLPLACSGGNAQTGSAMPSQAQATPPPTATPTLPDRFFLVGEASAALQVLAGTTPTGDLYVVTTNGYVPAPGGQPCTGGGEVRVNGSFYRASRKPDGFALSANGQHPNTGSFRIEAEGTVTAEGQATGTVRITTPTCDTGTVAWSGRLVSDQEFAAVLATFTRQEVLDLFGLSAPPPSSVDLAALIPVTQASGPTKSSATASPASPARASAPLPAPTAPASPISLALEPSLITFDVAPDVSSAYVDSIKTGIALARAYLNAVAGGDISQAVRQAMTVKVVATGKGNQEPGGGGACCTALDDHGPRPFFDVKAADGPWTQAGRYQWPIEAVEWRTAAHEYAHGWQSSLGCLSKFSKPLGDWYNEGVGEYVGYNAVIRSGYMKTEDVRRFELNGAISTGEAARPLQALEDSNQAGAGLWPGHLGYIAVEYLVSRAQTGVLALRTVCVEVGQKVAIDDAFIHAFGISRTQFYSEFPAYLNGLRSSR